MDIFNEKIEKILNTIMKSKFLNAYLSGCGRLVSIITVLTILNLFTSKFMNFAIIENFPIFSYIGIFYLLFISYEYAVILENETDYEFNKIELIILNLTIFFFAINILNLPKEYLSFDSLVLSMFIVFLVSNIYNKLINIKIKDTTFMPSGVKVYFKDLFISIFILGISFGFILLINKIQVAKAGIFISLFHIISSIISSYIGMLVIIFTISLLWLNGLHGASNIGGLISPFLMYNLYQNILGENIPFAGEMLNSYIFVGGSGSTLALAFILLKFTKSKNLRKLGMSAIYPAIFNTNEPMIFGIPIVKNKIMATPFIVSPLVSASLVYFANKMNLVNPIRVMIAWPTPIGIGAFISSSFDYRSIVLVLACVINSGLIYYPFVKKIDKQFLREEKNI